MECAETFHIHTEDRKVDLVVCELQRDDIKMAVLCKTCVCVFVCGCLVDGVP